MQLMQDADSASHDHDMGKAESLLKEAIRLGGNPDLERFHLVRLYEDEGRPKDALAQYRLALENQASVMVMQPQGWEDYADLARRFGTPDEVWTATYQYVNCSVTRRDPSLQALKFDSTTRLQQAADMVATLQNDQRVRRFDMLQLPHLVAEYPDVAVGHLLLAQELAGRLNNAEAEAELQKADKLGGGDLAGETAELRERISRLTH